MKIFILVRSIMDEVFGSENFFSIITFKKTLPLGSSGLAGISDYIIWYAKIRKK
jgi:adenine-specific DNA-methyltransferase